MIAGISYWFLIVRQDSENDTLATLLVDQPVEVINSVENDSLLEDNLAIEKNIYVHICGAVYEPGVYSFYDGARIMEGIDAAGGFSEEADKEYLNLAQKMVDGQKIYIPTIVEVQEGNLQSLEQALSIKQQTSSNEDSSGKININTATAKKLTELPGIGEKRAVAIIDYREQNGLFVEPHDLTKVNGISENIYESLKDMITIGK